jgi:hypothetical protein
MLDLYYKEEAEWQPLPAWVDFFYRLGYVTARDDAFSTVIVITPESASTLPFVALGTVVGCWNDETEAARSADEQWDALMRLQPGTPVSYAYLKKNEHNGHLLKLACLRVSDKRVSDELALEFRLGSKQSIPDKLLIRKTETDRIFRVAPLRVASKSFVPDAKVKERSVAVVLDAFLRNQLYNYYTQSTNDCLLLGTDVQLRQESALLLGRSNGMPLGTLSDVLRIREGNSTWHTMICPLRGHVPQGDVFRTVVFDGPTAWLRHRTDYSQSNHVVVVEHTHPVLQELLNEVRTTMRDGSTPMSLRTAVMPVPAGLEIIGFYRQ